MSYQYNQATLVGRLTRDPELIKISDSLSKAQFTLAVKRNYKKEDGVSETDFIPISLWGRSAETAHELLKKGTPVLVWGRIQIRTFKNQEKRSQVAEVVGDNFQILQPKSGLVSDVQVGGIEPL